MSATGRGGGLYTPEVLAAAMSLASYPFDTAHPLTGEARSRSCGSSLAISLDLDDAGRIERIGLRPHACAVGQAAASLFAGNAAGADRDAIASARAGIAAWLAGGGEDPHWPGFELLAPVRAYPARHAAILLAWDAALAAMPAPPLEEPGSVGGSNGEQS